VPEEIEVANSEEVLGLKQGTQSASLKARATLRDGTGDTHPFTACFAIVLPAESSHSSDDSDSDITWKPPSILAMWFAKH